MKGNYTKLIILTLLLIIYYLLNINITFIIDYINANIINLTYVSKKVVTLSIYSVFLACVYYIYKDNVSGDFRRFKRNIVPNIIMTILYFVALTLILFSLDYLLTLASTNLYLNYEILKFNNVVNLKLDLYNVSDILYNNIIITMINIFLFIIATNDLTKNKKNHFLVAGILIYLFNVILTYNFITPIIYFAMFHFLVFVYKKNHSNIVFVILTSILYYTMSGYLISQVFT